MGWTAASTHVPCSEWGWGKVGLAPRLGQGIWRLGADGHDYEYLVRAGSSAMLTASWAEARRFLAQNRRMR